MCICITRPTRSVQSWLLHKPSKRRLEFLQTGNVDLTLSFTQPVNNRMGWRETKVHADIGKKYRIRRPGVSCTEWDTGEGCTLEYLIGIIKKHAWRKSIWVSQMSQKKKEKRYFSVHTTALYLGCVSALYYYILLKYYEPALCRRDTYFNILTFRRYLWL